MVSMHDVDRRAAGRPRADRGRRRAADLGALERAREQDTIELPGRHRAGSSRVARAIVAFVAPYDVVLTPALAQRPVPIGEIHGRGPDPWEHYRRSGLFTPYTAIVNVTGQPAISLPLYHGDDGLPTAVQLIGAARAARTCCWRSRPQLEQALPWAERRPERRRLPSWLERRAARLSRPRAPPRIGCGTTPEALGVGGAVAEVIETVEQLGLVPGREGRRAHQQLERASAAAHEPGRGLQHGAGGGETSAARSRRSPGG